MIAILQPFVEDENQASKNPKVPNAPWRGHTGEYLVRRLLCVMPERCVVEHAGMMYGEGPKFFCKDIWPLRAGMEKKSPCSFCDDTNVSFCYSILPVTADGIER